MDSPHYSSAHSAHLLRTIREAVERGDWDTAATTSFAMPRPAAYSEPELCDYRELLQETLVAARIARADMAVSLTRLQAASRFQDSAAESGGHWQ